MTKDIVPLERVCTLGKHSVERSLCHKECYACCCKLQPSARHSLASLSLPSLCCSMGVSQGPPQG